MDTCVDLTLPLDVYLSCINNTAIYTMYITNLAFVYCGKYQSIDNGWNPRCFLLGFHLLVEKVDVESQYRYRYIVNDWIRAFHSYFLMNLYTPFTLGRSPTIVHYRYNDT